jgi:hypothetical protein
VNGLLSRRDSAIVAWHEVPGNRPPKELSTLKTSEDMVSSEFRPSYQSKSSRTEEKEGTEDLSGLSVWKRKSGELASASFAGCSFSRGEFESSTVGQCRPTSKNLRALRVLRAMSSLQIPTLEYRYRRGRSVTPIIPGINSARSYRTLRDGSFERTLPRHFVPWLRSDCPSGTKYILRAEALIKLAFMGFQPRGNRRHDEAP